MRTFSKEEQIKIRKYMRSRSDTLKNIRTNDELKEVTGLTFVQLQSLHVYSKFNCFYKLLKLWKKNGTSIVYNEARKHQDEQQEVAATNTAAAEQPVETKTVIKKPRIVIQSNRLYKFYQFSKELIKKTIEFVVSEKSYHRVDLMKKIRINVALV